MKLICVCRNEDCLAMFIHCGTAYETTCCPECGKQQRPAPLPELNAEERAAMDSIPKDFVERLFRGERPLTDPTTFAN